MLFPWMKMCFDPWDSFQVGFLPWDQTSNIARFDHHFSRGEKSATPFLVVRHRFRKVFWHRMGPLKENPTGYDEFYALWAFLSHSNHNHHSNHHHRIQVPFCPKTCFFIDTYGFCKNNLLDLEHWQSTSASSRSLRRNRLHLALST